MLFKWSVDFELRKDSPIAHIWITLHFMPINLCFESYLKNVVHHIGKCLAIDLPSLTHTRPPFFRVCVDHDLSKPRIYEFIIRKEKR